jgi:hypothetical protein
MNLLFNILKKNFTNISIFKHPLMLLLFFNFLNIFIFFMFYWVYQDDFNFKDLLYVDDKRKKTVWDILLLSTTVQAGVGITSVYPTTNIASGILTLQQITMIIANIIGGVYTVHFVNKLKLN